MRASNICTLLLASIAAARPAKLDGDKAGDKGAGAGGSITSAIVENAATDPVDMAPLDSGDGESTAKTAADKAAALREARLAAFFPRMLIGYRTVTQSEAEKINQQGTLFRFSSFDKTSHELGDGVYLSPGLGDYNGLKDKAWFCEVTVDRVAWETANKAWIPYVKPDDKVELHGYKDRIGRYLASLDDTWTLDNTIRMSKVSHKTDNLEMVLPTAWIQNPSSASHPNLNIKAICKEKKEHFQVPVQVKWKSWVKNVKGEKPDDVEPEKPEKKVTMAMKTQAGNPESAKSAAAKTEAVKPEPAKSVAAAGIALAPEP